MLIRPRTRHLLLLLALSLGCRKTEDETTPPSTDPPTEHDTNEPEPTDGAPEGLDPEALGGIDPELEVDPAKPREREKPADPQTRDAALVAAAHGNPDGAARFLTKHLGGKFDDSEAVLALARAQRLIGQLDEAEQTLTKLHGASKDNAIKSEALRRLAHLRLARGDTAKAEQHLRAAIKLQPDDLLLAGELVRLLFLTGRSGEPEARKLIDQLYAAYGDGTARSAEQLLGAAYAGLAERAFKSTSRVLQEAEQAAPPSSGSAVADEIAMQLTELFLEKYQPGEAATTLGLVLERDPWNPEALAKMGWVYLDQFALAAASRTAEEALQINPENADAHAVLAWVAIVEGRREEARSRIVDHVVNVNPSHHHGQAVLAALAIFDRDKPGYTKARDAALKFNPKDGLFFSHLSDLLSFLHLYPEADAVLVEGAALLPDDPYVQGALGLSRLRLGDEVSGRAALEKAWKKDKYNARTRNVRELYAERVEPHYAERKVGDLILRLPAESQDMVAPGYVDAISRARKALDAGYGIKISPLRIEMYAEPDEFSIRTVGTPSLGAVGVCFGPVITSIGPYMGTHNFDQVIWHEIAHSYAIQLSEGRVPRWFTEGLSEWESEVADPSWARESAELLYEARRADKLRKLSDLELAFLRAESPLMMEVAYATAAWAMRYLGETYGRPKIVALLKGYATGKSTDELFKQILGKDLATVEAEFSAWFDAEIDRKLSGWRPSREQQDDPRVQALMKAMEVASNGDLATAKTLLEKLIANKGDGYYSRLALATVLEQQKDFKAAIQEYEKAASFHAESLEPWIGIAKIARAQKDVPLELAQLEKILAIDAMSLEPPLRMAVLAAGTGDPRLSAAIARANAIAPLHPTALAGAALLEHRKGNKADKKLVKAMLDEVMVTALLPDATLDVVVMAAIAAEEIGDARVKDLALRALQAEELPEPARKKLKKHAP
ncbi:MAG TPA: tetratricopeptide repeat protein [Enhygromyxa sp.]|nr:tetratricopeptide repeat protein [Enhygromyxa sp.]